MAETRRGGLRQWQEHWSGGVVAGAKVPEAVCSGRGEARGCQVRVCAGGRSGGLLAPIATHTRLWHTGETLLPLVALLKTLNADRRGVWLGSVRLEESGEWSGGVPECRTAHAAHQQRVERGGRRPAPRSLVRYKAAKRILYCAVIKNLDRDVGEDAPE